MRKNLLEFLRGNRSQIEIASVYGVSQQAWSSWETGRTLPDNKIMLRMEYDFQLPMEVIFFESFNYKMKSLIKSSNLNSEESA